MADAKTGDALWKWILGGLAAGAAVLGLLVGAYAIGYDRGQNNAEVAVETQPAETTPPATEAPPAETTPPATEAPPAETASEADLVARGEELWSSTGCAGCHSLDGSAGAGPTVQGLAG